MNFTYNREKLIELMKDFYSLTKIKTAIYDNQFNYILGVPSEDSNFCTAIKTNKKGLNNCILCTKNAIEEVRKKNSLYIYKCHAGLIEAIAPIQINSVIVGYMMLGQILENNDKNITAEKIIFYKENYYLNNVKSLINSLTTKSNSEIKSAAKIMESCVCYLLMNQVIKENDGSVAFDINNFIKEHIGERITSADLCKRFKISRNSLYKISETYFGMPIAKYITYLRIKKAKELIKKGVSVTEVADITGFCDYGYFGKTFKKITGYTPTQINRK